MAHIPQPSKNPEGKLKDFYPLQAAELKALRKAKLINNTAYVHLALRCENPFCDRPIELVPKEFAIRWEIPESSVYEAISRLKATGAIVIKSGHLTIQWTSDQPDESSEDRPENNKENREPLSDVREHSESLEPILESEKEFPISKENSMPSEKARLKRLPCKGFGSSQKIQTYTDFQDSLPRRTRESFDAFCRRKVEECGFKIASLKSWLNKHWSEYWEEFARKYPSVVSCDRFTLSHPAKEKFAQVPFTLDQIKASYGSNWQEAARHFGLWEGMQ